AAARARDRPPGRDPGLAPLLRRERRVPGLHSPGTVQPDRGDHRLRPAGRVLHVRDPSRHHASPDARRLTTASETAAATTTAPRPATVPPPRPPPQGAGRGPPCVWNHASTRLSQTPDQSWVE